MRSTTFVCITGLTVAAALSGCGGGGGDSDALQATPTAEDGMAGALGTPGAPGVSQSQRIAAAKAAANSSTNACQAARPFYWEVGDSAGALASGSVLGGAGTPKYGPGTVLPLASASKWLYAAYTAQYRGGSLTASDIKFMNFTSGYISMNQDCLATQTVGSCLASGSNGVYTAQADGRFLYGGGHMQKHAVAIGLGALTNTDLAARVQSLIGKDIALSYTVPQPAGGAAASTASYTVFLRKILGKQLKISALLGSSKVCTNPATCPAGTAVRTPIAPDVTWHYSIGHWVEDDPVSGDGAFSSGGAYGFYPWIDASRSYYGVVARAVAQGGPGSASCGALIRKAWASGGAQ